MSSAIFSSYVFLGTIALIGAGYVYSRSNKSRVSSVNVIDQVLQLEERIQRDEGKRGIHEILPNKGELLGAAEDIIRCTSLVIITGFPCMMAYTPPTETDGPLGALCIARCALAIGKEVLILTDECNEESVLAAAAGSDLFETYGTKLSLESFPSMESFDENDEKRLISIQNKADLIVAIERTGPTKDGSYRTMSGKDMSHLVAPLELLITKEVRSIGIGDGGNEVGMGKVYNEICNSKIPNASNIACDVATDHLIVASVSNWGGYALAAAVAVLSTTNNNDRVAFFPSRKVAILKCLPSSAIETNIMSRLVESGARDGLTGKQAMMVDGMPFQESIKVLDDLKLIIS